MLKQSFLAPSITLPLARRSVLASIQVEAGRWGASKLFCITFFNVRAFLDFRFDIISKICHIYILRFLKIYQNNQDKGEDYEKLLVYSIRGIRGTRIWQYIFRR